MSKKNQKENKQVVFTETRKRGIIGTISEKVVPTLRVGMGTGGGNIPMIFQIRGGKWMTREYKETSPTLTTNPQHVPYKYTLSEKGWSGMLERQKKGQGEGFGLVNSNTSHTRTLKARYYKDGAEVLVEQKENRPRKLTPRECANLQGFPKDFKIVCSDSQAYKQFGNSVCVPLIKKIALRIQNVLKL